MTKLALLAALILLSVGIANAADCSYQSNGVMTCYDYTDNAYTISAPRITDGGYDTYNYGSGEFGQITPRIGGGYDTYNYGSGEFGEIVPLFGGFGDAED